MKEPKILPDGTDVHNIRKLSSRILNMFLYYHHDNDELRMVAEDEMNLRFLVARDYVEHNTHYTVTRVKQKVHNTEFSDCYDLDDEVFW